LQPVRGAQREKGKRQNKSEGQETKITRRDRTEEKKIGGRVRERNHSENSGGTPTRIREEVAKNLRAFSLRDVGAERVERQKSTPWGGERMKDGTGAQIVNCIKKKIANMIPSPE